MDDLISQWDIAAENIDEDPMRLIRYAMAARYFSNLQRTVNIVDIGCGEGGGLRFLQALGFRNLFGVEVSNERLVRTRERSKDLNIFHVSPDNSILPFSDNFSDVVISMGVIEHTKDPEWFVRELKRICKKDGFIVISSDGFAWRLLQIAGLYKSAQPIDKTMSFRAFRKIFHDLGLKIFHFDTFEWEKRGNVILHSIFKWRIEYTSDFQKELIKAMEIARSKPDYSSIYRRKKVMENWFADENIFLLKKS
ncbi:MAG: methyltransferase domain-containing protein [Candidatus Rifleibacteriota bacterium]